MGIFPIAPMGHVAALAVCAGMCRHLTALACHAVQLTAAPFRRTDDNFLCNGLHIHLQPSTISRCAMAETINLMIVCVSPGGRIRIVSTLHRNLGLYKKHWHPAAPQLHRSGGPRHAGSRLSRRAVHTESDSLDGP